MDYPARADLDIEQLGSCRVDSPWQQRRGDFVDQDDRVLALSTTAELEAELQAAQRPEPSDRSGPKVQSLPSFEMAGARRKIFFEPDQTTCALVTCGGLCPGINNVIRSIVLSLVHGYGVRQIFGFRYGFAGIADPSLKPVELTLDWVEPIHEEGGTLLGSSRGHRDVPTMVDRLVDLGVSVLFTIGGDGTQRGASALCQEIHRRGLKIAVIGVPKTIDNDILWVERTFGFATAVDEARRVIDGAHSESRGALGGVGLVKLMGRHAGFIAAHASLANSDVNFCLVPEVPFTVEGEGGLLDALIARLKRRGHAVIVVAEGAGQQLLELESTHDASGNRRLGDIGLYLKEQIHHGLERRGFTHTLKYIDPSYIVRSQPANAMDAEYCLVLGQHAVHAALAGRTNMLVRKWNRHFTHVPISVAVSKGKRINPAGGVWRRVLEATGQPASMVGAQPRLS